MEKGAEDSPEKQMGKTKKSEKRYGKNEGGKSGHQMGEIYGIEGVVCALKQSPENLRLLRNERNEGCKDRIAIKQECQKCDDKKNEMDKSKTCFGNDGVQV